MQCPFERVWERFPHRSLYPTTASLAALLDGDAGEYVSRLRMSSDGTDSFIRLSIALNRGGHRIDPIRTEAMDVETLDTGRGFHVIKYASEMYEYLCAVFGEAETARWPPSGDFPGRGRKGIIAFRLAARGRVPEFHLELYDGEAYRDPAHLHDVVSRYHPWIECYFWPFK